MQLFLESCSHNYVFDTDIKFIFVISTQSAILSIVNPSKLVMIYQIPVQCQFGAPFTNTNFN